MYNKFNRYKYLQIFRYRVLILLQPKPNVQKHKYIFNVHLDDKFMLSNNISLWMELL